MCRRQGGNTEAKVPTSVIPIQALDSWFLLKQRAGPFPEPPSPTSWLSLWGKFFSQRQIPLSRTLNPGLGERDNSQP